MTPDRQELSGRVLYPSQDFSTVGETGTSAHGLFLFVFTGGDALAFKLGVEGQAGYKSRNAGAAPGVGLLLTLHPGRLPPP